MKDGFLKIAAVTPPVRVCDVSYNGEQIRQYMKEADHLGAKLTVFPELCITGYTCQDLFLQKSLLDAAKAELLSIAKESTALDGLFFVGLPLAVEGKLYNVAAAICGGSVLGLIPKINLPNYSEFYEARNFTGGADIAAEVRLSDTVCAPFGNRLLFRCQELPEAVIGCELCEDLWTPCPPSVGHAMAGATIIVNLSASDEIVGKSDYRRSLVSGQSARLICGYLYCSAGEGESTQDVVYSGHRIISENGHILAEGERYTTGITSTEFDVFRIDADRRRMTTFTSRIAEGYHTINFSVKRESVSLTRLVNPAPFVPSSATDRNRRCEEILSIQSHGLKKRLRHIGCQNAVIGISGGLDSTLALLVTVRAFDLLGLEHSKILAVTMPGFGTTDRTYDNAVQLVHSLGATLREVRISETVLQHFRDIGHNPDVHDVTYENSQARERTQILMDLANQTNGIVIGTGDLSELALGWATYNGDHMSMYAVNASVPKTLVRHLVRFYADTCGEEKLSETLLDILDTPVSPELLPAEDGKISQKTEDLVGPYELHDFFLYHMLRFGSSPSKIYRLALIAFSGTYSPGFILKWEKTFYRRFFAQHFKRSCLPDSPKVGTIAVSPRGDLRMPSDAVGRLWQDELAGLS